MVNTSIETPINMTGKWRNLAFLSIAELLAMSLWFSASAVIPQLTAEWNLTSAQQSWMTMSVQVGFVVGARDEELHWFCGLQSLKVDNSSLTGESGPVSLRPDSSDPNHLESRNLAFYSTNVVEGTGTGLVIKTGDETVMGCIAGLVATLDSGKTPINKEVD